MLLKLYRINELPDPDTSKSPDNYDDDYIPILRELGVKNAGDIERLCNALADKIMQMQYELQIEVEKDIQSGKITDITEMPLYRDEKGELHNIPDDMFPWFSFMAWVNERGKAAVSKR